MKKIIIGVAMVGLIVLIVVSVKSTIDESVPAAPSINTNSATTNNILTIVPPTTDMIQEVTVSVVTMPEPGFIIIREVDDTRLGQIVEISRYLAAGTQKDITISLGTETKATDKLVVMLYSDIKSDQIMNDLDRPLRTTNNLPIAYYVRTGKAVPTDILASGLQAEAVAMMEMDKNMAGMTMPMETIRYTNDGYVPANVTIGVGTMVKFINESDQDMWVASNGHPAHTNLPTFDQFEFSPRGTQYVYTFDQVGAWKYHDHMAPIFGGVITVK